MSYDDPLKHRRGRDRHGIGEGSSNQALEPEKQTLVEVLQRKQAAAGLTGHVPAAAGAAQMLPEDVRAKMEASFGADFSAVRPMKVVLPRQSAPAPSPREQLFTSHRASTSPGRPRGKSEWVI